MPKDPTFADVIGDLLRQQGTICPICTSPNRADIEAAKEQGAPNALIAQALQITSTIDPNLTRDTASKRVRVHFEGLKSGTHPPVEGK